VTPRADGQPSRREWLVSWSEGDYPIDDYQVAITVVGGGTVTASLPRDRGLGPPGVP
jgi:hypothetical protein